MLLDLLIIGVIILGLNMLGERQLDVLNVMLSCVAANRFQKHSSHRCNTYLTTPHIDSPRQDCDSFVSSTYFLNAIILWLDTRAAWGTVPRRVAAELRAVLTC